MHTKIKSIYNTYSQIPSLWRFAFGVLLGNAFALQLPNFPTGEFIAFIFVCSIIFLRRQFYLVSATIIGFIFSLIFLANLIDHAPSRDLLNQKIIATGKIIKVHNYDYKSYDFLVENAVLADKTPSGFFGKVRLNWYKKDFTPKLGETWQTEIKVKQLNSILNPGVKDYTRSKLAKGIIATAYVGTKFYTQKLESSSHYTQLKQNFLDKIKNSEYKGAKFILALVFGDSSLFKSDDWNIFTTTGTLHLWVISGLHLGMLASILWLVFRLFSRQKIKIFFALGILLPIFYAIFSGWGIAAQRASFMLIAASLLAIGIRNINPWTSFSLALIAVLIYNPLVSLSAGFWLSFAAVASLIFTFKARKISKLRVIFLSQIVIFTCLAPLLNFFGQIPNLISPVLNLFLIPLISILLPLSMLGVWLYLSLDIGFLMQICSETFNWIFIFLKLAANYDFSPTVQSPSLLLLGWLIILPLGLYSRFIGLLAFSLAFYPLPIQKSENWKTHFLDVGQGLAVLVEKNQQFLLFDTGMNYSKDYAPIIPALQKLLKNKTLDYLIISHSDKDHSGALDLVKQNFKVKKHIGYKGKACENYWHESWQGLDLHFLGPEYYSAKPKNADSCTLLIQDKNRLGVYSLLIVGDILGKQELKYSAKWLEILNGEKLTLLSSSHHGSKTSSYAGFIRQIPPEYVVHSAGFRNRFKHPNEHVVQRFYRFDAVQFNTAESGQIEFEFSPTKLNIKQEKQQRQYLWDYLHYK